MVCRAPPGRDCRLPDFISHDAQLVVSLDGLHRVQPADDANVVHFFQLGLHSTTVV